MTTHTKDFKMAYVEESNYAGGNGGTKYAKTALISTDTPTNLHLPYGSVKFPYIEYEKESIKSAGKGYEKTTRYIKGYNYKEFIYPFFLQENTWITEIITNSDSIKSWLFHIENDDGSKFDAFGCQVKKYTLTANEKDFPKEEIEFIYWDVDASVALDTSPVFSTTQPKIHKDVTISINSNSIECKSATLTIERNVNDIFGTGKYQRIDPNLISISSSLEITFLVDSSDNLIKDLSNNSINEYAVVIGRGITGGTLTISKMIAIESNYNEVPEFGLHEYTLKLENSGDTSYSLA